VDPSSLWYYDLSASHLALDFANTVKARHTSTPIERLTAYEALVAFAEQAGLVDAQDGDRLRGWAAAHPDEAEALRREAVDLREALYDTFAAVAEERSPREEDLQILNTWVHRLVLGPDLRWAWSGGPDDPGAFLAPVVREAVDLLTSDWRNRVRICDADDCVWVFLDRSKNRSRRWCDMNQCGNRAKARRFYQRNKSTA